MKIIRTEQIFIRGNGVISGMYHISKNLFNQTSYVLRNQFFRRKRWQDIKNLQNNLRNHQI